MAAALLREEGSNMIRPAMISVNVDGTTVKVDEGASILQAVKAAAGKVPTLCFLKGISEVGACRICLVEVEGQDALVASCNTPARDGMVVKTNSARVRRARKKNLELVLAHHDAACTTCVRNTNCELQSLAFEMGISSACESAAAGVSCAPAPAAGSWPCDFPLVRDRGKCISCQRCIQVCSKMQATGVWTLAGIGAGAQISVSGGRDITETDCTLCGQCITHCPVGALRERSDIDRVQNALDDDSLICFIQIAPAVRTACGRALGLSDEEATVERLGEALRAMGFDYVFDTSFSADLTIMEEGSELLERLKGEDASSLPLLTSCCPGWVRFVKARYPHMAKHLSTAKSPQQMFGAIAKTYWAEKLGVDPQRLFCVSIMPCVAKKHECDLEGMESNSGVRDVDAVLTTRELERMIRSSCIDVTRLKDRPLDAPLGESSGAGVIFGSSGGVMEAALRSVAFMVTGKNPDPDAFREIRGQRAWREAEFSFGETALHIAIVNGLARAQELMEALQIGEVSYDFVEVMACPGGCVGGGGQPICPGKEMALPRSETLRALDAKNKVRFSHENASVLECYEEYLGKPLGEKAHKLLHSNHEDWSMPHV